MGRNFLKVLLITILLSTKSFASDNSNKFENMTILITSCGKYSSFWPGFFHQLHKEWPELNNIDKNVPIMLMTTKGVTYDSDRIIISDTNDDETWSENMLETLDRIDTDYVLIVLEDYYFTEIDRQRLLEVYNYMTSNPNVAYIQIGGHNPMHEKTAEEVKEVPGLFHKKKHSNWRTSNQACIWRKDKLRYIINPAESPWEFEWKGSRRSEGMMNDFLVVADDQTMEYLNMAHIGYVDAASVRQAEKLGIPMNFDLPVDEDNALKIFWDRRVKTFFNQRIASPFKKFFKDLYSLVVDFFTGHWI